MNHEERRRSLEEEANRKVLDEYRRGEIDLSKESLSLMNAPFREGDLVRILVTKNSKWSNSYMRGLTGKYARVARVDWNHNLPCLRLESLEDQDYTDWNWEWHWFHLSEHLPYGIRTRRLPETPALPERRDTHG